MREAIVLIAASLLALPVQAQAPSPLVAQRDELMYAIAKRDAGRVDALVKSGMDLNFNFDDLLPRQRSFESPLGMAIFRGHLDVARLLIAGGADVSRKDGGGRYPIHQARSADAVRLLQKSGADLGAKDRTGKSAAANAAERGDLEALDMLLANGARLEADGVDLLARAVETRKPEMIEPLLARGVDPRVPPTQALWLLIESGDAAPARLLVAKGAAVNAHDSRGDSLLGRALFRQRWEIAGALLDAGASTRSPDAMQMVRQASFNPPMLARLAAKGLDLNTAATSGHNALTSLVVETPMAIRAAREQPQTARVMQNAVTGEVIARMDEARPPVVTEIPAPDNVARVKALLELRADPNFQYRGQTPLMLAIVTPGRTAFEEPLIDAGARIEFAATIPAPDKVDPAGGPYGSHQGVLTGMSIGPLTWALHHDRPQVALRLVRRDRKIDPADRDLLYFAAALQQWEVMIGSLPYVAKKNVDAANRVGVTPLMLAARAGNAEAVRALLASGARVNARSALVWRSPDASLLGALSGHGPRPPDLVGGYTALRAAKEGNHTEAARLLNEAGGRE